VDIEEFKPASSILIYDTIRYEEVIPSSCRHTDHSRTGCVHAACVCVGSQTYETVLLINRVYIGAPAGGDTSGQCRHLPRRFCTHDLHRNLMCLPFQTSAADAETAPVQKTFIFQLCYFTTFNYSSS